MKTMKKHGRSARPQQGLSDTEQPLPTHGDGTSPKPWRWKKKLKIGDQPLTLGMMRAALGTPNVDTVMSAPLEDSFQYVRYLVDPGKAEDTRLAFTVSVEGSENPARIELRNGVIIISEASKKEQTHIDVSSKEWAEFVVGQRSYADRDKTIAAFESVLARPSAPGVSDAVDEQ
jgi:hypothetical protein